MNIFIWLFDRNYFQIQSAFTHVLFAMLPHCLAVLKTRNAAAKLSIRQN